MKELILMKCLECNGNKFTMDERMGELTCGDCGLVAMTELFEQSVSSVNRKGDLVHSPDKVLGSAPSSLVPKWFKSNNAHLDNGLRMCNMLLSTLMPRHPLRTRVEECYINLYRSNVLTTMGLEEKATAVVYYVLKENRTPIPLKELRKEFSCNTRTLNRAIKRINKHYNAPRKDGADPTYMLKRVTSKITDDLEFASKCQEVLEVFESITKDMDCAKGTVYYASICWIAKNMFLHSIKQKEIARKAKVSISSIKLTTKKLLYLVGYENCSQIKGKQINEIRRN
jgi:transcription initiation factor TFIIIB Brf1 subunit/transcription initiation factor TFIIB